MMKELKAKLQELLAKVKREIAMLCMMHCNVLTSTTVQSMLLTVLDLDGDYNMEDLYEIEPKDAVKMFTTYAMARLRMGQLCQLIANLQAIKLSNLEYISENPDYRETSIDENDNDDKKSDAMLGIMEMLQEAAKRARRTNDED